MKRIIFHKNAHSIAEWVIIFSLVPLAFLLIQSQLKRTLAVKAQGITDVALWQAWGDSPQQQGQDTNMRQLSIATTNQYEYHKQREGLIGSVSDVRNPGNPDLPDNQYTHSNAQERSASLAVAEGAEGLLDEFDLNQIVN